MNNSIIKQILTARQLLVCSFIDDLKYRLSGVFEVK